MGAYSQVEEAYATAVSGLQEHWFVADPPQDWHNYVAALPLHLRTTYTVVCLHKQVLNGGFDQYFWNDYGILFGDFATLAFTEIDSVTKAALVAEASDTLRRQAHELGIKWLGWATPAGDVLAVLEASRVEDELDSLTDKYYGDSEDPFALLAAYLCRLQ